MGHAKETLQQRGANHIRNQPKGKTMAYDDIHITEENGRLKARVPYNPLFARRARALGGEFDHATETWSFDPHVRQMILESLEKHFWWHEGQESEPTVSIRIDPYDGIYRYDKDDDRRSWFAGRVLAIRAAKNTPVKLAPNAALVEGSWPKNDNWNDGLNIGKGQRHVLLWDVPVGFLAHLEPGSYELADPDADAISAIDKRIARLREEKLRLEELKAGLLADGKDGE